jgi:hypothetical protein
LAGFFATAVWKRADCSGHFSVKSGHFQVTMKRTCQGGWGVRPERPKIFQIAGIFAVFYAIVCLFARGETMVNQIDQNAPAMQSQNGPRPLHNLKPIKMPERQQDLTGAPVTSNKNGVSSLQEKLKARQSQLPEISDMVKQQPESPAQSGKIVNILA